MGGGLMQLVAYGAQDIYLTGNPQITFFKVVYRRHTNFSMESIQQTWNGSIGFGNTVTATISRNGDLVSRMYIQWEPATLGKMASGSLGLGPNIGNCLLKEMECEIGGQRIDKHYGHWLTIWNELTESNPLCQKGRLVETSADSKHYGEPPETAAAGATTVGAASKNDKMSFNHLGDNAIAADDTFNDSTCPKVATIPLQFWFCRNPGLALPLIALQYHEVKIKVTFGTSEDFVKEVVASPAITGGLGPSSGNPQLYCDYIYLDTDERRRFAQVSHEYLIEQLQVETGKPANGMKSHELNFNHPVKELIWVGSPTPGGGAAAIIQSSATPVALYSDVKWQLKLNGHDRFSERKTQYFTRTQPFQHHTGHGGVTVRDSIAVYSFALKPEEHQPSGTCNFSRIDNAQLHQTSNAAPHINVYAVNYNVLRIMSGMGGLAYSN